MKRDRLFFSIILAISFLFPLSCANAYYNNIVEADFLMLGTKYETADIDNLVVDKHNLTAVTHPLVSTFLHFEGNFWGRHLYFPLSASPNRLVSSVLRCWSFSHSLLVKTENNLYWNVLGLPKQRPLAGLKAKMIADAASILTLGSLSLDGRGAGWVWVKPSLLQSPSP